MLSRITPIAPSKSKQDLFNALMWSETNEHHRRLYTMMMEEANQGRERALQRANFQHSGTHVTETSKHLEIQEIYRTACEETRAVYDLGVQHDGGVWENWIIRWTLWHSFRYRDDRNRNRYSANPAPCVPDDPQQVMYAAYAGYYVEAVPNGTLYYDPVRDT